MVMKNNFKCDTEVISDLRIITQANENCYFYDIFMIFKTVLKIEKVIDDGKHYGKI